MKRNRKIKKHVVFSMGTGYVVTLILTVLVMLMVYWALDQDCASVSRAIAKADRELKALDGEYGRESAKWAMMTTPEKLNERLVRFGIEMRMQGQDQIVRMDGRGRPLPGLAVTRARNRMAKDSAIAQADRPAASRKAARVRR